MPQNWTELAAGIAPPSGEWAPMALAVAGVVVGLTLWLSGGRMLRPLTGLIGLVLGGSAGYLLLPGVAGASWNSVPTDLVGGAAGAVIGCGAALGTFRLAMGALSGGALGAVAAIVALGAFSRGHGLSPTETGERIVASLNAGEAPGLDSLRASGGGIARIAAGAWEVLSAREQTVLIGAAGVLALAGFCCGVVMPKRAAAAASATAGATALVASGAWLATHVHVLPRAWLTPAAISLVWVALAAAGTMVQWPASKPARA